MPPALNVRKAKGEELPTGSLRCVAPLNSSGRQAEITLAQHEPNPSRLENAVALDRAYEQVALARTVPIEAASDVADPSHTDADVPQRSGADIR
jgi:hypothetical protein